MVGCGGTTTQTPTDNGSEISGELGSENKDSGNTATEKKMIKNKELIKVLVIGHSFSNNSTQYASQMVADFGGNLEISSLYYAGCTLEQHYNFIIMTRLYFSYLLTVIR